MKIENVEMIVNFGALGYDAKKISSILGVPEAEIIQELKDKNSELSKLFQKGVDMSDYVIDLKIFRINGTKYCDLYNGYLYSGENSFDINIKESGNFIINIQLANQTINTKFTVY